uniref:gastrokine-3-like n=1 Tax=Jaculus jaculus TaxID=51337 RepID=UPI001E1AFC8F|nr:gastrokine-3-like [Jaculus jaculus]
MVDVNEVMTEVNEVVVDVNAVVTEVNEVVVDVNTVVVDVSEVMADVNEVVADVMAWINLENMPKKVLESKGEETPGHQFSEQVSVDRKDGAEQTMGFGVCMKSCTRGCVQQLEILPSILVTFFLAPSLAMMNTSDSHPLDGSVGTQTIHINAFRGTVSIRDNNVLSEWDGILDYKNRLLVVKLFSKMACVLAQMDQAVFPSLDDIRKVLGKQASSRYPPTSGLSYTVLPTRVKNLAQYGMPIKNLCRAVPAYFAQQQKAGTALAIDPNSCSEIQLLTFMGLSICGESPGL